MTRRSRYSPEVKERAVRMVFDQLVSAQISVVSDLIDRVEDWLHGGNATHVGAASGA